MGIPIGLALDYPPGSAPQALLQANGISHWVAENEEKWANEWSAGGGSSWNPNSFGRVDTMLRDYNALTPRYHNFVWHKALPPGLVINAGNWQSLISSRINALCTHYPNMSPFVSIDVVNEAFLGYADGAPYNYIRNSVWYDAAGGINGGGPTWWWYPLQVAQALIPSVASGGPRFLINDFECGENDKPDQLHKFTAMFNGVQAALNAGVRVDGIGWQCHLNAGWPVNYTQLAQRCQQWMTLVPFLEITELNIVVTQGFTYQQAATYASNIVKVITENANVPTITGWTAPGDALLGIFENNALTPLGQALNWNTPTWT